MDWAAFARDVSLTLTAWVAIYGIDSWRREFVWKRNVELAEEALALFYEARDVISYIRSPAAWGGEGQSRKKEPDETSEETRMLDATFVAVERYNKHLELFSKLQALRYRFMAKLGHGAVKPFDDLRAQVNSIVSASHVLYMMRRRAPLAGGREHTEQYYAKLHKFESVIWEGLAEEDALKSAVDRAVTDLEAICRPIITSKGTLFSALNAKLKLPFVALRIYRERVVEQFAARKPGPPVHESGETRAGKAPNADAANRLEQLEQPHKKGLISDAEYAAKRKAILDQL